MGTWGYRTFENDAASDWLYDLEEARSASFLLAPIRKAARSRKSVDIDDAIEALAAAEVLAASRQVKITGLPKEAIKSIQRLALAARNSELNLAIGAVQKIRQDSDLRDSWVEAGTVARWQKEVDGLLDRLKRALSLPVPKRQKVKAQAREQLGDLIVKVAETKDPELRKKLQDKLAALADPDAPVRGKGLNTLPPLSLLASRNLTPEARLLLELGAKVDIKSSIFAPPIAFAIDKNHVGMVKLLLEFGADPSYALRIAVQGNRVTLIKMLLQEKGVSSIEPETGNTLLHIAAGSGSMNALKYLLTQGCEIDARNSWEQTPLQEAVDTCHLACAKVLLQAGANPHLENNNGQSAFDLATEVLHIEPKILKVLEKYRPPG